MSEFGGLGKHDATQHALVGLGSAAPAAAVAFRGQATRISRKGLIKCKKRKRKDSIKKLSPEKNWRERHGGQTPTLCGKSTLEQSDPVMEYATTSRATASSTNKGRLDKVQYIALRATLGRMKTSLIKEMEKRADIEPLEHRRNYWVLVQTQNLRNSQITQSKTD